MLTRANAKYSCAPAPGLPAEPQKFAVSLCSLHLQSPHGDRRYRAQLCQIARLGQSPADRVPETRRSLCNRTLAQHKLKPRFDGPVVSLSVVCGVRCGVRERARAYRCGTGRLDVGGGRPASNSELICGCNIISCSSSRTVRMWRGPVAGSVVGASDGMFDVSGTPSSAAFPSVSVPAYTHIDYLRAVDIMKPFRLARGGYAGWREGTSSASCTRCISSCAQLCHSKAGKDHLLDVPNSQDASQQGYQHSIGSWGARNIRSAPTSHAYMRPFREVWVASMHRASTDPALQ